MLISVISLFLLISFLRAHAILGTGEREREYSIHSEWTNHNINIFIIDNFNVLLLFTFKRGVSHKKTIYISASKTKQMNKKPLLCSVFWGQCQCNLPHLPSLSDLEQSQSLRERITEWLGSYSLGPDDLHLRPGPVTDQPCDLGQVTCFLCASVSYTVKFGL